MTILDRVRLLFAGTSVDLILTDPSSTATWVLKAADGLGPPAVDVYVQQSLQEGGVYKGRRPQNREITLRIGLNPNYSANQSVVDLRKTLYRMLNPNIGDYVFVQLMESSTVVQSQIYGYVKTFEIAQFTSEPEVSITIACVDPYFSAPAKVTTLPSGKVAFTVTNAGDAPTGIFMEIVFTVNRPSFVVEIDQPWTASEMKIESTYDFKAGDKYQISTNPGGRYLHVIRASDGLDVNIINTMTPESAWIMLPSGASNFVCDSGAWNWSKFEYTPQFWGI